MSVSKVLKSHKQHITPAIREPIKATPQIKAVLSQGELSFADVITPKGLITAVFKSTAVEHGSGWCEYHEVNHKPSTHCPYKDKADKGEKADPTDSSTHTGFEEVVQLALKNVGAAGEDSKGSKTIVTLLQKSGLLEEDMSLATLATKLNASPSAALTLVDALGIFVVGGGMSADDPDGTQIKLNPDLKMLLGGPEKGIHPTTGLDPTTHKALTAVTQGKLIKNTLDLYKQIMAAFQTTPGVSTKFGVKEAKETYDKLLSGGFISGALPTANGQQFEDGQTNPTVMVHPVKQEVAADIDVASVGDTVKAAMDVLLDGNNPVAALDFSDKLSSAYKKLIDSGMSGYSAIKAAVKELLTGPAYDGLTDDTKDELWDKVADEKGNVLPAIHEGLLMALGESGLAPTSALIAASGVTPKMPFAQGPVGAPPPAPVPAPVGTPKPKIEIQDLIKAVGTWDTSEGAKALKYLYKNPGVAFTVDDVVKNAALALPSNYTKTTVENVVKSTLNKAVNAGGVTFDPATKKYSLVTDQPAASPGQVAAAAPPMSKSGIENALTEVLKVLPAAGADDIVDSIQGFLGNLMPGQKLSYSGITSMLNAKLHALDPNYPSLIGYITAALDNAGVVSIDSMANSLTITKATSPTGKCQKGHNTYKTPVPHNCPTCGTVMAGATGAPTDQQNAPAPPPAPPAPGQGKAGDGTFSASDPEGIKNALGALKSSLESDWQLGELLKAALVDPAPINGAGLTDLELNQWLAKSGTGLHKQVFEKVDGLNYLSPHFLPTGVKGPYNTPDEAATKLLDAVKNTDWFKANKTAKAQEAALLSAKAFIKSTLVSQRANIWKKKIKEAAAASGLKNVAGLLAGLDQAGVVTDFGGDYKIASKYLSIRDDAPVTAPKSTDSDDVESVQLLMDGAINALEKPSTAPWLAYAGDDAKFEAVKKHIVNTLVPKLLAGESITNQENAKLMSVGNYKAQDITTMFYAVVSQSKSPLKSTPFGQYLINPSILSADEPGPYLSSASTAVNEAKAALAESALYKTSTPAKKAKLDLATDKFLNAFTSGALSLTNTLDVDIIAKDVGIPTKTLVGVLTASDIAIVSGSALMQNPNLSSSALMLNPKLWWAGQTKGQASPSGAPGGGPQGAPSPSPYAPPGPPAPAAPPAAKVPVSPNEQTIGQLGGLVNSLLENGKASGQSIASQIAVKLQQISPTLLGDDDAKVKATKIIEELKGTGLLKPDVAGDLMLQGKVPTAPAPLTVAVPDMKATLSALGWNVGGKGEQILSALNKNGDAGASLQDVLSAWQSPDKPSTGVAAEILDSAMEKGVVKRVPGSNPAKYLFTDQVPPPADPAGKKPTGKCQNGHNTYKSPVPSNCPTCGTPMTGAKETAPTGTSDVFKAVSAIPDGSQLKILGNAKGLGGIKDKFFGVDASGQKYLIKPDSEGIRPAASQSASEIGLAVLGPGNTVPVKESVVNGQKVSIQPMMDVAGDATTLDLKNLTDTQKDSLIKERVYDWLIGSHDTKPGNFIVTPDGKIVGIDKEQAFKFIGKDKLSNTYSPNPSKPIYNDFFQLIQDGAVKANLKSALPVIEAIEKLSDEKYVQMIKPYLDQAAQRYGWNAAMKADRVKAILNRKNSIRSDFEKYFNQIQPGFTFGGGSAPATPPAAPSAPLAPPIDGVASAAVPDATALKLDGSANVGGAKPKQFYSDAKGNKFLFKPSENEWRAAVQQAVGDITGLILPPGTFAPVKVTKNNNGNVGTIQPWLPIKSNIADVVAEAGGDFSKLPVSVLDGLQREKVIDWLFGNHDSHGKNIILTNDGQVVGIDKEQAFKHIGKDQLNTTYHPNAQYGEAQPIANDLYAAFEAGKVPLDPMATHEVIKRIEAIPDSTYMSILMPYIDGMAKDNANPTAMKSKLVKAILQRKHNIRSDFEQFYSAMLQKQGKPPFKYPE